MRVPDSEDDATTKGLSMAQNDTAAAETPKLMKEQWRRLFVSGGTVHRMVI